MYLANFILHSQCHRQGCGTENFVGWMSTEDVRNYMEVKKFSEFVLFPQNSG